MPVIPDGKWFNVTDPKDGRVRRVFKTQTEAEHLDALLQAAEATRNYNPMKQTPGAYSDTAQPAKTVKVGGEKQ